MKKSDWIILVATAWFLASCGVVASPTPITVVETVEVEVTKQVTQEVIVTATPEPMATATPEPEPILVDDFETGEGEWSVFESDSGTAHVRDGRLVLEVHNDSANTFADHPEFPLLDAHVLEVDISYISGPTESEAGIAFRCKPVGSSAGLQVAIDAEGSFSVGMVAPVAGQFDFVQVIPKTLSTAIVRSQAVNHVRLIDDNRQVTVYINDELMTTFPYDTVPPGCPVFFVNPLGEAGAAWAFDDVSVRDIGP